VATLGQRILWRAVPVGVVTTLIGYGLLWGYLSAAAAFTDARAVQSDGPSYTGPLVLGFLGFAIMAAIECVRIEPPPKRGED
jgi:hypothetical protein